MSLSKIQIRVAPLSNRVVLARFGKDPNVALETRDAMNEFLQTLTSYAFDGKMPEIGASATLEYGGGNEQFEVRITRAALKGDNDAT